MAVQRSEPAGSLAGVLHRREVLALFALLAVAAGIRAVAWVRTAVIFDDGPVFLYIAQAMRDGHWLSALQHDYHPLYPLTIWLVGPGAGDLETTGAVLSVLFGVLGVGLLYGFLRDTYGHTVAWLGAALLAIHPRAVAFTSDVQSDGLYMALFLGALWAVWRALATARLSTAALAGVLIGLAYLTRPEGLGIAIVAGLAVLWLWLRSRWNLRRCVAFLAALAIGLVVTMLPYVTGLKVATGEWQLTQKKSIAELVSLSPNEAHINQRGGQARRVAMAEPILPGPSPPRAGSERDVRGPKGFLGAAHIMAGTIASAWRVDVLLLVVVGLVSCRGRPGPRGLFVGALVVLYGAVLFALAVNADYVSRRHALIVMLPLLGYAGVGVESLGRGILVVWQRFRGMGPRPRPGRSLAGLLGVCVVAALWIPLDLKERRSERQAIRRAAEWLRAHDSEPGPVATRRIRIAYYAGGRYVPLPGPVERGLPRFLDGRGVEYVIIDEAKDGRWIGSEETRPKRLELLHRSSVGGNSAAVFRVRRD